VQAQSVVPERYGVPFVAGGAGATSIYGRSKWVFGTLSPVENLADTQMEFCTTWSGRGAEAAPQDRPPVGEHRARQGLPEGVLDFVKAHPKEFSVAVDESFELYAADFKPLLTRPRPRRPSLHV